VKDVCNNIMDKYDITSCLKEVKFAYRNLILIFHPDKYNKKNPFTEEEGSSKFQCIIMHTNP